jgi:hypothetical protein
MPLILEVVGDKVRGAALLTCARSRLWRVDKLANAVQFERALTAVRVVASAAAAGPFPQDALAALAAAAAAEGGGQRADAVRGLAKEAAERCESATRTALWRLGGAERLLTRLLSCCFFLNSQQLFFFCVSAEGGPRTKLQLRLCVPTGIPTGIRRGCSKPPRAVSRPPRQWT